MKKRKEVVLGVEAMDKITGFKGIVVGCCVYLFGCKQYGLCPKSKTGERKDTEWFDEGRIEAIGKGINAEEVSVKENGADYNHDAPRHK